MEVGKTCCFGVLFWAQTSLIKGLRINNHAKYYDELNWNLEGECKIQVQYLQVCVGFTVLCSSKNVIIIESMERENYARVTQTVWEYKSLTTRAWKHNKQTMHGSKKTAQLEGKEVEINGKWFNLSWQRMVTPNYYSLRSTKTGSVKLGRKWMKERVSQPRKATKLTWWCERALCFPSEAWYFSRAQENPGKESII